MPEDKVIPVRVAVRCRPLVTKEILEGCKQCVTFVPNEPQLILGKDKTFTYDYAFKAETCQNDVYEESVASLVEGIFKGYNATVLAYGQTGSGKTHTMGGGYGICQDTDESITGVIPRAIRQLFDGISKRSNEYEFTVRVSYLEIYKEDLLDLLCHPSKRDKDGVAVREDVNGGIRLQGLTEVAVESAFDTIGCLERGSQSRTTGATSMNTYSSRSHAIFTIHIDKVSRDDSNDLCKSKFHLVDLAGSERAKKTNAEGERFREGVNINKGLLALGNVISALGDESQKRSHIPYRDSKLTRLLQDSLGGNSWTLMIACISPADSNMEETLSTLRYADRARKIKNKPVVNRDPQAAEILRLKHMVQDMQIQLLQSGRGGCSLSNQPAGTADNPAQLKKIKDLEVENKKLTKNLQNALQQNAVLMEKLMAAEVAREQLKETLDNIKEKSLALMNITYDASEKRDETKEGMDDLVKSLHETITTMGVDQLSTIPEGSNENTSSSVSHTLGDEDEFSSEHVQKLQNYHDEINELDYMIQSKQDLAAKMASGEGHWQEIKVKYEKEIHTMESEISGLMKEKDDMQKALQDAKSTSAASKISEQRRKRLQDLESQISQLRKKMVEQSKLLKMKEQTGKQLQKCNQDIASMKCHRVKLMKQMKEDSEAFRRFKQAKDKEVTQLKAKERKREAEIVKMNRDFQRQQNVLKRKAAEASAVNKRLQEALSKQRQAQDDRLKKQEKSDQGGIGARVRKWLGQEFEVMVSMEELRLHLNGLISDRKELSSELEGLKEQLKSEPPTKRRSLSDRSWRDADEDRDQMREKIKKLEQEIEIQSGQINDIQEKLMDANQDDKTKTRWNNVHTLIEARCGLKWLMSTAVSAKVEGAKLNSEMTDLNGHLEEAMHNVRKATDTAEKRQRQHEKEVHKLAKEHEEKVLYFLNQLKNSSTQLLDSNCDEDLKQRLRFQEAEIEKLSMLRENLDNKSGECDNLRKELTKVSYLSSVTHNQSLMPDLGDVDMKPPTCTIIPKAPTGKSKYFSEVFSPAIKAAGPSRRRKRKDLEKDVDEDFEEDSFSDTGEEPELNDAYDQKEHDPDWKSGCTPGVNRIAAKTTRRKTCFTGSMEEENKVNSPPVTRLSCKCTKSCSTKSCTCVKNGLKCDENLCKCASLKCLNRELQMPESTTDDSNEQLQGSTESTSTLNTTFNIAYVETASEADTTSDSKASDTAAVKPTVLKETNANSRKSKKKTSDGTAKSYHTLFGNAGGSGDQNDDDSLQDFDTEGIGLGGMHKKKKRTLLKAGANTIFNQNL